MTKLNIPALPFSLVEAEKILFSLSILLLPTQIGKHFWPDFAFIYSIKTDYFSPVIYGWDLLVIALLVISLIRHKFHYKFGATALLVFFISQLGSFFLSNNLGASFVRLEQYFIIGLWGLYIANGRLREAPDLLWKSLGIALLWTSCLGVGEFLAGKTLGFWILGERSFNLDTISIATFDWYDQVFLRPYSTFPHPNVFAAFLLIGVILFEFLRVKLNKSTDWFYRIVLIFSSVALFLTFSRVAAGLYSVVLLYLFRKRLRLLLVIFMLLLPFLFVRFHSAFNFDQLSFIRREELAVAAIQLWTSSPVFGVGLNNFVYELAAGRIVSGEVRFLQPVHMIYLLTLSETGIVGMIGLIALFVTPIIFVKNLFKQKSKRIDFMILGYGWVCILLMGAFDHFLLTLAQGLRIFFLVWGITMLQYGSGDIKENRKPNRISVGR